MKAAWHKCAPVMACIAVLLGLSGVGLAQGDQVGFGRAITVEPGETRGDISCFDCAVYVRGMVKGDIAVFGGRVVLEGTVTGDVALFWGDVHMDDNAQVRGDVAVFGGALKKSPSATIGGDQASFSREQAIAGAIIALALMGGAIGLLVWLIASRRQPTVPGQPIARRSA